MRDKVDSIIVILFSFFLTNCAFAQISNSNLEEESPIDKTYFGHISDSIVTLEESFTGNWMVSQPYYKKLESYDYLIIVHGDSSLDDYCCFPKYLFELKSGNLTGLFVDFDSDNNQVREIAILNEGKRNGLSITPFTIDGFNYYNIEEFKLGLVNGMILSEW